MPGDRFVQEEKQQVLSLNPSINFQFTSLLKLFLSVGHIMTFFSCHFTYSIKRDIFDRFFNFFYVMLASYKTGKQDYSKCQDERID